MDDFLQTMVLLRARYQRPAGFNLFSVLRNSSDEVRLHSRLLAFLLDPKATHNQGTALLNLLLKRVGTRLNRGTVAGTLQPRHRTRLNQAQRFSPSRPRLPM
ncbi:PD-(D/E)XK nuclease family protein [Pseudomonas gingeri]|uniref:PD-(D/E)XK nuclease family protein n=1 Tax=Pseudomonas gingeri TaxID=117681 RepID=UPI00159FD1A1|nr:PD-(D/E)XK nuclease family protein [Pseudomonas gingeri]